MGGELDGQIGLGHDLIAHKVGQRHFTGGDEVQGGGIVTILTAFFGGKQIGFKLGQLPGAAQAVGIDDVRRVALGVTVFLGLHVQHELGQGPVQSGDRAFEHAKARARQLGAGFKVQAQGFANVHMVFGGKAQGRGFTTQAMRGAPAAQLNIAVFVAAQRHAGVGQIGQGLEQGLHVGLQQLQALGRLLQVVFDAGHLGHDVVHAFALGFALANLLGQAVAPGLQLLGVGLQGFALTLQRLKGVDIQKGLRGFAGVEALQDMRQVASEQIDIEHGGRL